MIYFYYFVLHGNEKDLAQMCVVGNTVWFKNNSEEYECRFI